VRLGDCAVADQADTDRGCGLAARHEHKRPLDELLKSFQLIRGRIVAESEMDEMSFPDAPLVRHDLVRETPARPKQHRRVGRRSFGEVQLVVNLELGSRAAGKS